MGGGVQIVNNFITKENINDIFKKHGYTGEIALLSIDIDGNDYWVWDSINSISPQVIVAEHNYALGGLEKAYTIPYDANFSHLGDGYFGASYKALNILAQKKGYTLVYLNGLNLVYVRNDFKNLFADVDINMLMHRVKKSRVDKRSYWGSKLLCSVNKQAIVYDVEENRTVKLCEDFIK